MFTLVLKALFPNIFLASFGGSLTYVALLQDVSFCHRNQWWRIAVCGRKDFFGLCKGVSRSCACCWTFELWSID